MANKTFSQKFWEDDRGKVVVWQKPNLPLTIWFLATVGGMLLPNGFIQKALYLIGLVALVVWSILEISRGVNYFRRLLGLLVLLSMIISRLI